MKTSLRAFLFIAFAFSVTMANAQQSVSIGTPNIDRDAVLLLVGDGTQGLIIPNTDDLAAMPKKAGMVVYNATDGQVYSCDGNTWTALGGGSVGANPELKINGNNLSIFNGQNVPLALANPTTRGQILMWNGTGWTVNASTAPATNDVLVYNGNQWVPSGNYITAINGTAPVSVITTNNVAQVTVSNITNNEISNSANISDSKLATISTAGKVSGSAINSGTITGSTAINTTGNITTTGTLGVTGTTTLSSLSGVGNRMVIADAAGVITTAPLPINSTLTNLTSPNAAINITNGNNAVIGLTPVTINIANATTSQAGLLTASDFTMFSNKQNTINLTTTGTSGAATLVGGTLNIPQYAGTGDITDVVAGIGLTGGATTGSATLNVNTGTGPSQIVQLDASSRLPAVDGSQLTNLAGDISAVVAGTGLSGGATTGSATLNVNTGTGPNQIVQLDASSRLPAVDGSQLTNLSGDISSVVAGTGLTGGATTGAATLNVNTGTGANQIVQLDASSRLPAVDGSQLTNLSGDISAVVAGIGLSGGATTGSATLNVNVGTGANQIPQLDGTGKLLVATIPTGTLPNQIVQLDGTGRLPAVDGSQLTGLAGGGDITGVTAGTGLTGGAASGNATLNVNVGTGANQIVQLDASSRLPAVDGSQLTNLPVGGDITDVVAGTGLTGGAATGSATLNVNVGTGANQIPQLDGTGKLLVGTIPTGTSPNQIVQLDGTGRLPAVDGSQLTGLAGGGDITGVTAGTGLTGGAASGNATLNVNVGTGANQIVQLDASSRLPAVDGSQLTNLPAGSGDITDVVAGTGLTGGATTGSATLNINVGTGANQIPQLDGAGKLNPVVLPASVMTNPLTTNGDIIYGVGSTPTRLAAGSGFLKGGAVPSYSAINLATADVTGTLPIAQGGTGAATPAAALVALGAMANPMTTAGDIIYRDGTGPQRLAAGTGFLRGGASPSYSAVGLASSDVTGILPIAQGGTNSSATPTNGGVGYGTGTAHAYTAAGTSGQFLQSNGAAAPTWVNAPAAGWGLTGNAGTNPATNFIGTTDAQPLRFGTGVGGVERMRVTAAGNIGIGTTNPGSLFTVEQAASPTEVAIRSGTASAGLIVDGNSSFFSAIDFHSNGTPRFGIGLFSGDFYIDESGIDRRFTVEGTTGFVGIGNIDPTEKLNVDGPIQLEPTATPPDPTDRLYNILGDLHWNGINISSGGGSGWGLTGNTLIGSEFIGSTNSQPLIFSTNTGGGGGERMRITPLGDVGIGIIPGRRFQVSQSLVSNLAPVAQFGTTGSGSAGAIAFSNSTSQLYTMGILSTGDFAISKLNNNVSVDDAIRVTTTGNVGISKAAPSERLDVVGNVRFSGALMPNNLPGTSGQVLTSAGAGAPPTWTTISGGGNMISTNNLSDVANVATARTNLGLGSLATLSTVTTTEITDGTIANVDIASVDASKITTGTLPVARGGTGVTTATNGQLLIGNGTGFTAATLTAGTNVAITNGAGSITINANGLANPMTAPGDIIYGGVGGTPTALVAGTGFLKGGASPTYAAVNLATADVTGTLPIANGGTGATTAPLARTALGLGSLSTLSAVTTTEITDGTITNIDIADVAASKVTGITANTIPSSNATGTGLINSNLTYLAASSRVGINSTTPNSSLHVHGIAGQPGTVAITNSTTGIANGDGANIGYFSGSSVLTIENLENSNISIRNNGAQRFVIDPNGALGIGATPTYGTTGQVLTSQGAGVAPVWAAAGAPVREVADEFTAIASQTSFTLTQTPSANSKVKMFINGIRVSNNAYNVAGTTLTYNPANNGTYSLTAGDRIQFDYYY